MDTPADTLARILSDPGFAPYIVEKRVLPAVPADYRDFPEGLDSRLDAALRSRGIDRLYSHQREVWEEARAGRSVVVVTPTASGKTLSYNLPVLQTLLEDPDARALYLFPTKALSQDQQAELNGLVEGNREQGAGNGGDSAAVCDTTVKSPGSQKDSLTETPFPGPRSPFPDTPPLPIKIATYDGDTPDSLRVSARETGRIIISNPDMLHAGVLPNHPKWIRFFSNLKYIVIDEAHSYRGVFGSHVANVIRRLRRVAAFYGSRPQFILCSATIANPRELASTLTGGDVVLVDKNGAPRGEKIVILYNPPLVDAVQGIRKSVVTESRRWMLAFLRAGIKTILFAHSRVKTEVLASYVNEDLKNIFTANSGIRVEAYRGGLLPNERHEIERGLREGTIRGVVSTNALELGIDIGGLDASVVAGFPGSFNSFWQQSGRAGRRGGLSVSVFVASAAPLDQFLMADSAWFFAAAVEEARLDPDNPYIFTDHIKCACFELPFRDEEADGGIFPEALDALSYLQEDGIVRHTGGAWHWADRSFPAEGISLRSATADNVVIIDITAGRNEVIGEMDRPSAKELIFPNAVYMHRGRQFLVETLDIANRKCLVREAEVNYFTDGLVKTDIKVLSEDEAFTFGEPASARAVLGDVLVRSQASKFKKIRFHTHENVGYGSIDMPEEEMQTRALAFLFAPDTAGGAAIAAAEEGARASILGGAGTLIKSMAPALLLCDPRDLGIAERVRDPHYGVPAIYVYDRYPGGAGLSEALPRFASALFAAASRRLDACPCKQGCPSCVGPGGNKSGTAAFLRALQNPGRRD